MKAFRFPLEKVLAWRKTQLDAEQAELRKRKAVVAAIDQARSELRASGIAAEIQLRDAATIDGSDLEALGRFRTWVREHDVRLARERLARDHAAGEQRSRMLEARRRYRLLERLRERRLAEWTVESNRELETFAAEAFLSRWPGQKPPD